MDFDYINYTPYSLESEQSVLGSMIIDGEKVSDVLEIIKPQDFYIENHKIICNAIIELFNNNDPVDIVSISNILKSKQNLELIGDIDYLVQLTNIVPTTANIKYYARIVKEKSVRRQVIQMSHEIIKNAASQEYDNAVDIQSDALEMISSIKITDNKSNQDMFDLVQYLKDEIERKRNLGKDDEEKYYTGFSDYDYWLDGLHKQELTIIGARPSVGKTAFALQIAKNLSKKGLHTLFYTLEMPKFQLVSRLILSEAKINSYKVKHPKTLTENDLDLFNKASDKISNLPFIIKEEKYIQDIRSQCRFLKNKGKLDLLVVDYIQLLLTYKKTQNRTEELGDISRNLKSISKEFDIPVIALAQLTRDTERQKREPILSDLRECGDMEQDADNVIFIHSPNTNEEVADIQERKIIIAKQRNGATGAFSMLFEGKTFSFMDVI